MNKQPDERIEAYLLHRMTQEERTAFENELATDSALQDDLYRHARTHTVINHAYNTELKTRLARIDRETDAPDRTALVRPIFRRIAVAAAVLVALALVTWIWADHTFAHETIAANMMARTVEESLRSRGIETLELEHIQAEKLFLEGEYNAAEIAFSRLAAQDNAFASRAEWNLLMTYLVQDDEESFDRLFSEILGNERHDYQERAAKLAQKLQHPLYRLTQ